MTASILVTGDVVLDCHLYGGVPAGALAHNAQGSAYSVELGGAVLSRNLLAMAVAAEQARWDSASRDYEEEARKNEEKGKPAPQRPDALLASRLSLSVDLAVTEVGLREQLPSHLHSFGVWTDRPVARDSTDRVWRIDQHFGYGRKQTFDEQAVFRPNAAANPTGVDLVFIDDGGMLFRNGSNPPFRVIPQEPHQHYLLKMSRPLCRGALWTDLQPLRDRLTVVVSSADLRREDASIGNLSWEQCAEDTLRVLTEDVVLKELRAAADLVISFSSEGALWLSRGDEVSASTLFFAASRKEGEFASAIEGSAYGFQTCFATGIAFQLMKAHAQSVADRGASLSPFTDGAAKRRAFAMGITSGLTARRRLLEWGHGKTSTPPPGFPVKELGACIANQHGGFVAFAVPALPPAPRGMPAPTWSILTRAQNGGVVAGPLFRRAELVARYGPGALSDVPLLRLGEITIVDRGEIESMRILEALIRDYEAVKVQKRPLSIAVFGPPGAGKSFGVKSLAKSILGKDVPFLELNLSQFGDSSDLIGALHRVRDAVLGGLTPVAFFDEFDASDYKWLQYLLAPMQDGVFQEGQIAHPVGKCIFVFAGGTSTTLDAFGVQRPRPLTSDDLARLDHPEKAASLREHSEATERFRNYTLIKGPDFVSRLHGFLEVLGPNPRRTGSDPDVTWPIRRALLLRGVLKLEETEELNMDPGLLHALLSVNEYTHGARSVEKIALTLKHRSGGGRIGRSQLPPRPLLSRETNAAEFHRLVSARDAFKNPFAT